MTASGAGLLERLPALPAELGLGLAHSRQARVGETSMVEPLSMLLEVLGADAATVVRSDEFVVAPPGGSAMLGDCT